MPFTLPFLTSKAFNILFKMKIQSSRNEGTRACGVRVLRVQIFMYNVHCRLQLKKIADFFFYLMYGDPRLHGNGETDLITKP
jgi:hypothetical protein